MNHLRLSLCGAAAFALGGLPSAQDAPFNASRLSRFDEAGSSYADVWGSGNLAFLARFGQAEIDIVDISDPTNPVLLANYDLPSPDNNSSAQDIRAGDGLLFIASESGGANGVHIVDIRNPSNPILRTTVDVEPGNYEFVHNVFYDNGWLYIVNSSDNTVALVDLRTYDPDDAPAAITGWTYRVTGVGSVFVHDVTVNNGLMYCSAWGSLEIYDVSNLDAGPPVLLGSELGISSHAVWPTADNRFAVTCEERGGGALRLYEIIDNGSSVDIVPRDSYQTEAGRSFSIHNSVVLGDRVYSSWYQAGLLVHEIDRTSKTLEFVASFDTSTAGPSGFSGNWGAYPLLGADRVLASDTQTGLHVLDMSALQVSFVDPRVDTTPIGTAETVTVRIDELGNKELDPGTVELRASVNGQPFEPIPMANIGGGQYQAALPLLGCDSVVEYYVSVRDVFGEETTDPVDAPANMYRLRSSGAGTPVLVDDFETDQGWLALNDAVNDGGWVRAIPGETGAQPGGGDPDEAGATCFVTGAAGGSSTADDVDGGPARLISPTLDFSAGDGLIRYSRWFFNDDGDGDSLLVEITNDPTGHDWVLVEEVNSQTAGGQTAGGWVRRVFRLSDYVTPNATVRMRFSVADAPNNSTTEAAIDAFRAERFDCVSNAVAQVRVGTGVNANTLTSLGAPSIGTDWQTTIDSSAAPAANLTYLLGFERGLDPGLLLSFGELLVDLGSEPYLTLSSTPSASLSDYVVSIPSDPAFQGFEVFAQGVIFGTGFVELTNALDVVVDY